MKLDANDLADLQPLIAEAVRATIQQVEAERAKLGNRIGYTEPEAAGLLGLARHCLRDARLRNEITAKRVGSRWIYSRKALEDFLQCG